MTGRAKRRRNIVRSICELRQMETSETHHEKAEEIKETLEKYVRKHLATARKAAHQRALGDEAEAQKVYYEGTLTMPLTYAGKKEATSSTKHSRPAAA